MKNDITNVELAERLELYILMLLMYCFAILKSDMLALFIAAVIFFIRMYLNYLQNKKIALQDKIDELQKTKGTQ